MPIGEDDNSSVKLEIKPDETWEEVGRSEIQPRSYNALFRIENFNYKNDVPYRLSYDLKDNGKTFLYEGTFKPNPVDKETIVVAGFTGNHNLAKGVERAPFNWKEQIWYPHTQLINNVEKDRNLARTT